MNNKRRSSEIIIDNEVVPSFKKINLSDPFSKNEIISNTEIFRKKTHKEYSDLTEFDRNNMNFMMLHKQKNALNNISKLSKKMYNLNKKCETINNKTDKLNKKMCSNMNKCYQEISTIKNEIDIIKQDNKKIMNKLDSLINLFQCNKMNTDEDNLEIIVDRKITEEKVRSHKLEEYGFYG